MYIFYLSHFLLVSYSRLPIISVWFTISESFVGRYFSTHMPVVNMFINGQCPTNQRKFLGSMTSLNSDEIR